MLPMKTKPLPVGGNIRQIREVLGITPEALAKRISAHGGSLSGRQIRRIEDGSSSVSVGSLTKIAAALGVEPARLFQD
jgi:transcriptional regulator with XRE-family HTH domain